MSHLCMVFLLGVSMEQLYMSLCFEAGFMNLLDTFKVKMLNLIVYIIHLHVYNNMLN